MTGIFAASSPRDEGPIYDLPPAVGNDQKVAKHKSARQGEGLEERYQGREQSEKERRHGCLVYDVLPRAPVDHQQQRGQSLNPGFAGNGIIVDTGRLKDSIQFKKLFFIKNLM